MEVIFVYFYLTWDTQTIHKYLEKTSVTDYRMSFYQALEFIKLSSKFFYSIHFCQQFSLKFFFYSLFNLVKFIIQFFHVIFNFHTSESTEFFFNIFTDTKFFFNSMEICFHSLDIINSLIFDSSLIFFEIGFSETRHT